MFLFQFSNITTTILCDSKFNTKIPQKIVELNADEHDLPDYFKLTGRQRDIPELVYLFITICGGREDRSVIDDYIVNDFILSNKDRKELQETPMHSNMCI